MATYAFSDLHGDYQLWTAIKNYCKDDDILPWFGQLMTRPQLIAYLYQFDLWIDEYNIEIKI